MIRHAVFFRFKDDASEAARQQHIDGFAALPEKIGEIRDYEWGHVIVGPDAKGQPEFHVAHYVIFDDVSSLQTYIDHTDHQRFIERNRSAWDGVKVIDSEIAK